MNRAIQSTDNLDELARSVVARARRDAAGDITRAVEDGTASNHKIYRDAYNAAVKAGLKRWGELPGRAAAAEAADEEQQRLEDAGERSSRRCFPVQWRRMGC